MLRVHSVLAQDVSFVPSTHVGLPTTSSDSSIQQCTDTQLKIVNVENALLSKDS